MKITVYSVALLASLSLSGRASAFDAIVDVLSVTPVREIVNEPYESCGTEYEQQTVQSAPPVQEDHSLAGAIAGGVAGGLLGSLMIDGWPLRDEGLLTQATVSTYRDQTGTKLIASRSGISADPAGTSGSATAQFVLAPY